MVAFKFPIKLSALAVCSACIATSLMVLPVASQAAGGKEARVVVSYQPDTAAEVLAAVARLGGRVVADLSVVNSVAVSLPASAVATLKGHHSVELVEEDVQRTLYGVRGDASAAASVASAGTQVVPYGIPLVQADQLTGPGKWKPLVCIVDSGIDATHEDLAGIRMRGANFTESGEWSTDEQHHGTHVAGTIAARNNKVGVVGVNDEKQVSLFISKVFGSVNSASSSTVAQGMAACLQAGANVVSMSLGGAAPSGVERRIVQKLHDSGALIIAASGNTGNSSPQWPAAFSSVMSVAAVDANKAWAPFSTFNDQVEISGPGVSVLSTVPMGTGRDAALSVSGTQFQANPLDGSPVSGANGALYNFGTGQVDDTGVAGKVCVIARGFISFAEKVTRCQTNGGIGAVIYNNLPGNFFGSLAGAPTTIPSMSVSQADGATLVADVGQTADLSLLATNYAYFNGTSMATPHVSGVAALVWSFYPECTAHDIRVTLRKSALDIGDPGYDIKTGRGLVQAKAAFDRIASLGCGM